MSYDNLLAGYATSSYTPVELLAGDAPVHTAGGQVLISGQNLAQFTVVGRIAASSKLTQWNPAGNDGSQIAVGFLAHAINASAGDQACQIYIGGMFNVDALVWPSGVTTFAAKSAAFERTPLIVRQLMAA